MIEGNFIIAHSVHSYLKYNFAKDFIVKKNRHEVSLWQVNDIYYSRNGSQCITSSIPPELSASERCNTNSRMMKIARENEIRRKCAKDSKLTRVTDLVNTPPIKYPALLRKIVITQFPQHQDTILW